VHRLSGALRLFPLLGERVRVRGKKPINGEVTVE
jgi:hypothetical protein